MPRQMNPIAISCAASYFAGTSRNLTDIAIHFNVSERTVRRWSQETAWEEALNIWGYNDDRSFEVKPKRDAQRDARELFAAVQQIYKREILDGIPRHRLARIVVELAKAKKIHGSDKLTPKRVREWAKAYRWAENPEETDSAKIYCAATYYAFRSREIREIAETFQVAEHEITQWIEKHPDWYKALNICGITPRKKLPVNEELKLLSQKTSQQSPMEQTDTEMDSLSGFNGWQKKRKEPPSREH